jgi:type VI secretion system secreted protein Hcp
VEELFMDYAQLKQITLASAIAVACTLPIAEDARASVFAKYDGVDGESADATHKGEIDVLSWSWGMSSEEGSNKLPCVEDLRITKFVDSATPGLIAAAHSGDSSHAVITVERDDQATLILEVVEVAVKEMHFAQRPSDNRPMEEVALNFSEVLGTYQRLPDADGTSYPPQPFVVIPGKCESK